MAVKFFKIWKFPSEFVHIIQFWEKVKIRPLHFAQNIVYILGMVHKSIFIVWRPLQFCKDFLWILPVIHPVFRGLSLSSGHFRWICPYFSSIPARRLRVSTNLFENFKYFCFLLLTEPFFCANIFEHEQCGSDNKAVIQGNSSMVEQRSPKP